jgi:predicted nucleic acid-binding protein
MLDTSFLITLVDDARRHHPVARRYFEIALQQGVPLYVSTLALAEFAIKQAVTDLPLNALLVVPFNIRHASVSGEFVAAILPARDAGDDRTSVRTDLQLIAQAHVEGVPFLLTEDRRTLSKYADRARAAGICQCRAVVLADGFDAAWFNEGQRVLDLADPP